MDTTKAVRALLADANKQIDNLIDDAVKGRKLSLLRPLTLAQKNIELVGTHLTKYEERAAPKAVEQPAAAATTTETETAPAAPATGKGKK